MRMTAMMMRMKVGDDDKCSGGDDARGGEYGELGEGDDEEDDDNGNFVAVYEGDDDGDYDDNDDA